MTLPEKMQTAPRMIGDHFEVIGELGRGGIGVVLKARHVELDKVVAIKVMSPSGAMDDRSRSRFNVEAMAGSRMSHPNLVQVFDKGFTEEGQPYLVMEYIEGYSLDAIQNQFEPMSFTELVEIFVQAAKGLRYLHEKKIVHRDLKPSNIMVQVIGNERYAKLVDLGIAKVYDDGSTTTQHKLTETSAVFGSPVFMSPEQCRGDKLDERSDIYSFGCVIYHCVLGRAPFADENPLQVLIKHLEETPEMLPFKTEQECMLADIVHRCLQKKREDRFQNAQQLVDQLSAIVTGPVKKPDPGYARSPDWAPKPSLTGPQHPQPSSFAAPNTPLAIEPAPEQMYPLSTHERFWMALGTSATTGKTISIVGTTIAGMLFVFLWLVPMVDQRNAGSLQKHDDGSAASRTRVRSHKS